MSWMKGLALFLAVPAVAAELPYAFTYGGEPYAHLEERGQIVSEDADRRVSTNVWTASDGLFRIVTRKTEYKRFGAVEYAPRLEGVGTNATEIIHDFRVLSLTRPAARAKVRALRGTVCSERDFEAVHVTLGKNGTNSFSMVATEGRSSAQWMPWWGIDYPSGDGVEIGIGWTGAWRADLTHTNGAVTCTAGMTETHFRILPGESLRQPSVLVFTRPKNVSPRAMQTRIHRLMLAEKSPRDAKGELLKPILPITAGGGNKTPEMMFKVINWVKANQMPFDCFWVDAGWNGPAHSPDLISNCGNMWSQFVGDWRFNPTVHPDGNLAQVADAAHAAGLRMLLWIEPERCVSEPPPPVFREHRDWLLPLRDADITNKRKLNVNLGNPAAWSWVLETVSRHVRESKLDVYRQDFNLNTLPLWQANDAADRKGVTEMKYIDGLYAFWDELRRRFPHLVLENCASGGRRLDFEAVSRAHTYCRTDFAIGHAGPSQVTDVQNILLNTLAYVPFQGSETTPARFFDDYGFFSSVAAGSVFTPSDWNAGIVKNPFTSVETAWFKKVFDTANRMRPFFLGDYYPLVEIAPPVPGGHARMTRLPDECRWCAYQLHRADLDAGCAIAFRRLDTPSPDFAATLSGLDPSADYEVDTYGGTTVRMKGAALADWHVRLERLRDFKLIFYRKLPQKSPSRAEVRVTDEVNATHVPARIPQGAGEFEIERPRSTGGGTVRATDFGFSTTNTNNAAAIMRALAHCRATGAARLELAPGTYSCFDADHGVIVADMTDFTLDGQGATLVFRRPSRRLFANSDRILSDSNLLVSNCVRSVIRNFKMDWDWATDPLCDVGVVVGTHVDAADNASYFDLVLPDWPQGHPWYGRPMPIQTMTPINAARDRLTGEAPARLLFGLTEGHYGTKMAWLAKNRIRVWPGVRDPEQFSAPIADTYYGADINRKTAGALVKGINYRVFHHYYGKGGITLDSGRHVTIEDVDVISCFGMPIVVTGAIQYGQFVRVTSEPMPGRPCAGTSDGCHIARSQGHIKFLNCRLSLQNDDGFNWHDCFTIGVPDGARRLKVTNLRGPKYLGAEDGDELELLREDFRPLGWKGRLVRTDGDTFIVDRDLPPLEGEHFLIYDNTYRSDYILMKDCVVHDTHFREIVQPNHVTVENCIFLRTGGGMKMGSAHSREFWCEGKGSKDVVFRACTFDHTNLLADWAKGGDAPEFETYVRFPRPKPYDPGKGVFSMKLPPDFDLGFHGDILVEKCRFIDPIGTLFVGNPVRNLIFRDNEIEWTGTRRLRTTAGGFRFGAAQDVFITGNHYRVASSVGPLDPKIVGTVPGLVVSGNTVEFCK